MLVERYFEGKFTVCEYPGLRILGKYDTQAECLYHLHYGTPPASAEVAKRWLLRKASTSRSIYRKRI